MRGLSLPNTTAECGRNDRTFSFLRSLGSVSCSHAIAPSVSSTGSSVSSATCLKVCGNGGSVSNAANSDSHSASGPYISSSSRRSTKGVWVWYQGSRGACSSAASPTKGDSAAHGCAYGRTEFRAESSCADINLSFPASPARPGRALALTHPRCRLQAYFGSAPRRRSADQVLWGGEHRRAPVRLRITSRRHRHLTGSFYPSRSWGRTG